MVSVIGAVPSGSTIASMNFTEPTSCRALHRKSSAPGPATMEFEILACSNSWLIVFKTPCTASKAFVTFSRLAGAKGSAFPTALAKSEWLMRRFLQSRANFAVWTAVLTLFCTWLCSAGPCCSQNPGNRVTVRFSLPALFGGSVSLHTRRRRSSQRTFCMLQVKPPPVSAFNRETSSARVNSSRNSSRRIRPHAHSLRNPWNMAPNSVPS